MNHANLAIILAIFSVACSGAEVLKPNSEIGIQTDYLSTAQQEVIIGAIEAWNQKADFDMTYFLFSGNDLPTNAIVGVPEKSFTCAGMASDGCTTSKIDGTILMRVSNYLESEDLNIAMRHELGHGLGADHLSRGIMCLYNNTTSVIDDTALTAIGVRLTARAGHEGAPCSEL